MTELLSRLAKVQAELKAPKKQFNNYGGYRYRSQEDILEALKPVLAKYELALTVSDRIIMKGDRFYIKATATVRHGDGCLTCHGYAREAADRKGMDDSQITGSASSYARKYALNGLFLIDDTQDADATNDHGKTAQAAQPVKPEPDADFGI